MSIDLILYLLSVGLVTLSVIAIWQAFKLRGIYRVKSSWVGAFTFVLLGGRQFYTLYRLHAQIETARAIINEAVARGVNMRGVNLDHLNGEQWLLAIWSYVIMIGFIIWQDMQHRELRSANMIS